MYKYTDRFNTFKSWNDNNFDNTFVDKLTKSGFYFSASDCSTICVFCNIEIKNWTGFEEPDNIHKKMSPFCPVFLKTQFSTLESRLETFRNYPNKNVNVKKLAESGFFYIGFKDIVQCFNCKIKLEDWEEGDDPDIAHNKINKFCEFIKSLERTSNYNCEICLTNPKNICFLPCAHVFCCLDCVINIQNICPICRGEIKQKIKLYI